MSDFKKIEENQKVEFKEKWNDNILAEITAFANSDGGRIYIGIRDDGKVVGVNNLKKLLEIIPNKIINHLGLVLPVDSIEVKGKKYIKIEVAKSSAPISYRGKIYKRSGSTKCELKGNELFRFLMAFSDTGWDGLVEDSATLYDLDLDTMQDFRAMSELRLPFARKTRDDILLLEKLGLSDKRKLTKGAIMLFGKNPQKFYPSAFLKIGKFETESDLISHDLIKGNLFNQIRLAEEILRTKYLKYNITFEGMQRIEKLEYPEKALREVLVNALVHKDYLGTTIQLKIFPDKLVIWNEGQLPENLTIEKLLGSHPSKPRNELIANVFFYANYIDAWGRGIQKILDSCKENNLPAPEFKEDFGGLQVTIYKDIYNEKYLKKIGLNERQVKGILYIKENKKITNSDYRKLNYCSRDIAKRDIDNLVKRKIFELIGKGRYAHYILMVR